MNEDIQRIKGKIQEEAVKINDIISKEEIEKFEKDNDIILPKELVLFYTEIGNGCQMIDGFYLKGLEELKFDTDKIKKEFIFTKYWIWEDDENIELLQNVGMGNIKLIDVGDSQSWHIIVKGIEKGQMWFFADVGIQPCAPKRSFLSWFEYWLDGNNDYF